MSNSIDLEKKSTKVYTIWPNYRYIGAIHMFKKHGFKVVVPLNRKIENHPGVEFLELCRFASLSGGQNHHGIAQFIQDYWNPKLHTTELFTMAKTRAWLKQNWPELDLELPAPCDDVDGRKCGEGTPWRQYFQKYRVLGVWNAGEFVCLDSPFPDEVYDITERYNVIRVEDRKGRARIKISRKIDA